MNLSSTYLLILFTFTAININAKKEKDPGLLEITVITESLHQRRGKNVSVNDFRVSVGQHVVDPIHFGHRYESYVRLMHAMAYLY